MNPPTADDIFIPKNTRKKLYPVFVVMVICLFVMVTTLGVTGEIPDLTKISYNLNVGGTAPLAAIAHAELPSRIVVPSLGIDSVIINPMQSDIESLDRALLQGVVRYPGSGSLGTAGNIILFGHSSHLKFVNNKAYQSFNDINTLKMGDEIKLYGSASPPFTYRVTKVSEVKETAAKVAVQSSGNNLTLITCNNFGAKEDRYIVEAQLIK